MQATTVESFKKEAVVLTTREASNYLRISRPTYLKYICLGRKGDKAGKGWKVLKSEMDRFLKAGDGNGYSINGGMSISR